MSDAIKDLPKEGEGAVGEDIKTSAEEKPFDFNQFKGGDSSIKIESTEPKDIKKEEPPKKEEPKDEKQQLKEEPKTESKTKVEEPPKNEEKSAPEEFVPQPMTSLKKSAAGTPKDRNFEGMDPHEVDFGKKMDFAAFEYYRARVLENKELKGKLKETEQKYAEAASKTTVSNHEQGYVLDSRYQEAVVAIDREKRILNHWEQQLANVLEAKDWQDLTIDKEGNIIASTRKASANDQIYLQKRIAAATQIITQQEGFANDFQRNHKQIYQEKINAVKQMENYMFPMYADDQVFDENKHGKGMKGLLVRAGEDKNILAGPMRKLYAIAMQWKEEADEAVAELEKLKKIGDIKKDNLTAAEINKGQETTKSTTGDDAPVDLTVFEKIKANA